MTGVSRATMSGIAEYKTAVIDEVTYCSAQNNSPYWAAIMVKLRTRMARHCLFSRGHCLLVRKTEISKIAAATAKRIAAAFIGGTSRTTRRIASHVLPHIR